MVLQVRTEAVWVGHFVKKVIGQCNKKKEKKTWFDCLLNGFQCLLPALPLIQDSLYTLT